MANSKQDHDIDMPFAKSISSEEGKHDHLEDDDRKSENRQEALIDESIEETFPASDPASPKHIT